MSGTAKCVYCNREIRLTPSMADPERNVFVGHVNGKTNRSCKGSGVFAVYGMHSNAAYDFGAG